MSGSHDEKLESMLRSRRIEPAGPDLAQRIILKAQGIRQNQRVSIWRWVWQLCAEYHLPKPAYVLGAALLLGLMVGLNTPSEITSADDTNLANVQGFLSADEGPL